MFHYIRCITPKLATSWRGPSPRHCARGNTAPFEKRSSETSRWQRYVQFDRPEI